MKEISDIIEAYDRLESTGRVCALATVVHVQGSSYRRPGARMLVSDEGQLTGAISGGCLEGDALRKALLAIAEGKNKLVTYDTTDEDDAKFGVQLGCNGIVHILFEPINAGDPHNPLMLLKKVKEKRLPVVLATFFSLTNKSMQPGTGFLYGQHINIASAAVLENIQDLNTEQAGNEILLGQASQIRSYNDGQISAFLQFIPPSPVLVIAGAGNDAIPLAALARLLGLEIILADGRQTHANVQRFPQVQKIIIAAGENVLKQILPDDNTVFVLMTHNYNYDLAMLKELLKTTVPYIGILGPKTKMQRMYDDLEKEGIKVPDRSRIYSPVGLDIGAETAEEIALSVAAEIKAVIMNKNAQMLRTKTDAVHS